MPTWLVCDTVYRMIAGFGVGAMQTIEKRHILGWCLFDFAGTFLMANGGLYFASWLVVENGIGDLALNVTFAVSTVAVLVLAPLVGALSDRVRRPVLFLKVSAALMLAVPLMLYAFAHYGVAVQEHRDLYLLGALLLILSAYQFASVFYNSILKSLTDRATATKVSGWGITANWLGAIVGVLTVLPFVEGMVPGVAAGKAASFLPSALGFALFAGLSFMLMPGDKRLEDRPHDDQSRALSVLSLIRSGGTLLWFLVAFALFMDAILTIQNNLPIYLERALGFPAGETAVLFLALFGAAAGGGLLSIPLIRAFGALRCLQLTIALWTALLIAMSMTSGWSLYLAWFAAAGLLFGIVTNAARVLFLGLVPAGRAGEYFGVYNAFERTASIIGPLAWGTLVTGFASSGMDVRYRIALGAMSVFTALALLVLLRIKNPPAAKPGDQGARP